MMAHNPFYYNHVGRARLPNGGTKFVTGHALMVDGGLTAQLQDAAAQYVEKQVLSALGLEGR